MKQFFKYTLATIVGIIIASLLMFFIFMGVVGAIASSSEKSVKIKPNSVYELELKGELVERSKDDPFSSLLGDVYGFSATKTIGLDDMLSNIQKAKSDPNIEGIYLKNGTLTGGYASFKEVRDALLDFKSSGKFIVAYADTYTQKCYYLSSVADKMFVNPQGMIEFQGIAATTMFFKNTFEKLGIDMQVVKVGTYKSAVEPYIQTKMSDANREQMNVFTQSIWKNTLNEISASRGVSVDSLNGYADEMMTFQATEKYLTYNMVDSLTYESGMEEVIKKLLSKNDEKVRFVSHSQMNNAISSEKTHKNKIAIIYGVGGIDMSESDGIVSSTLVKEINKVKEDKMVKAVVFRVNSGGGSAYGSEQIWNAIGELKKEKPVVVSMGDYAASGGYYISCIADSILAQPNTLTGSIGIFGTIPNVAGLNAKIGLTYDGVKTNKLSDAITINRAFSPEERNLMQGYVDRGYELFVKRCADGRNKSTDDIKAIAEGRVWTGEDALKLGLVDKLGGINDAVKVVAQLADLQDYSIKTFPQKESFFSSLMKDFETSIVTKILKSKIGAETYQIFEHIDNLHHFNGVHALMPYLITLN